MTIGTMKQMLVLFSNFCISFSFTSFSIFFRLSLECGLLNNFLFIRHNFWILNVVFWHFCSVRKVFNLRTQFLFVFFSSSSLRKTSKRYFDCGSVFCVFTISSFPCKSNPRIRLVSLSVISRMISGIIYSADGIFVFNAFRFLAVCCSFQFVR